MPNPDGFPSTLVASHPGNQAALKSGVFSRTGRSLAPRATELADVLMGTPFVASADRVAVEELASLLALAEAMDRDIEQRGLSNRRGDARTIVKLRLGVSRRLQEWLSSMGLTPRARAELARVVAEGALGEEIARRRASVDR